MQNQIDNYSPLSRSCVKRSQSLLENIKQVKTGFADMTLEDLATVAGIHADIIFILKDEGSGACELGGK